MANLAIKGHKSRGNEVIEILEMLGGKNDNLCYGGFFGRIYFINENGYIEGCDKMHKPDYLQLTLEEFLEKFPYKIGDRVRVAEYESEVRIDDMKWDGNEVQYEVFTDETEWYSAKELNLFNEPLNKVEYEKCSSWLDTSVILPYKEETIDKTNKPVFDTNAQCCDIMNQLIKEETMENKPDLLQQLKDYFDNTPREVVEKEWHEYDKYNEIGPTVDEYLEYVNKIRQPKYPKTYEECCNVIGCDSKMVLGTMPVRYNTLVKLEKLLICRDAYWEIVGWRPTKDDDGETFSLFYNRNSDKIDKCDGLYESNAILDFPTKELREAFYENFKELINQCKELL